MVFGYYVDVVGSCTCYLWYICLFQIWWKASKVNPESNNVTTVNLNVCPLVTMLCTFFSMQAVTWKSSKRLLRTPQQTSALSYMLDPSELSGKVLGNIEGWKWCDYNLLLINGSSEECEVRHVVCETELVMFFLSLTITGIMCCRAVGLRTGQSMAPNIHATLSEPANKVYKVPSQQSFPHFVF